MKHHTPEQFKDLLPTPHKHHNAVLSACITGALAFILLAFALFTYNSAHGQRVSDVFKDSTLNHRLFAALMVCRDYSPYSAKVDTVPDFATSTSAAGTITAGDFTGVVSYLDQKYILDTLEGAYQSIKWADLYSTTKGNYYDADGNITTWSWFKKGYLVRKEYTGGMRIGVKPDGSPYFGGERVGYFDTNKRLIDEKKETVTNFIPRPK